MMVPEPGTYLMARESGVRLRRQEGGRTWQDSMDNGLQLFNGAELDVLGDGETNTSDNRNWYAVFDMEVAASPDYHKDSVSSSNDSELSVHGRASPTGRPFSHSTAATASEVLRVCAQRHRADVNR
jgi:hypothetical protein